MRVTSRLASVRRVIGLPDGAQVHCDDSGLIDRLGAPSRLDSLVDHLERRANAIAAALIVCVASLALLFTYGLPELADRMSRGMPPAIESMIGDQVMAALDGRLFRPTRIEYAEQRQMIDLFETFIAGMPEADRAGACRADRRDPDRRPPDRRG